jgi:hypothetical protein
MNANTENFETLPVAQEAGSRMDLWEPPFERWMRIADALLNQAPAHFEVAPRPQTFIPAHRG